MAPVPSPVDRAIALRDAIHDEATERTWSQGVTLARGGRVAGLTRSGAGDVELEVRVPGRPTPFTVHLDLDHQEWECDCPSREPVCSHAAAAAIALAEAGDALPVSRATGAAIRYRLSAAAPARVGGPAGGLVVERFLIHPDGREEKLVGSALSPDASRPALAMTEADVLLDQMLLARAGVLAGDRVDRVLAVLADAKDVRFGDAAVTTSGDLVLPRAIVEDDGPAVAVTVERDPEVTEVVAIGVARCGSVLRPIGAVDLGGVRLEKLPWRRVYAPGEWPALVSQTLPDLARRIPVDVRTARLPAMGGAVPPRIDLDVRQDGDTVSAMATLVYGDPPRARIDGGRLVHLQGALPIRDEDAERALLWRLRDELNLAPGRRITATGKDGFALATRLATWLRTDANAARAGAAVELTPEVTVDGATLRVTFTGTMRAAAGADARAVEANPEIVVRAWQAGADVVPLVGGGWGRLPTSWLADHGHRLADLLASRGAGDRVPLHALPDLARLSEELDQPPPADLERLRPLLAGFEGLPHAPLPAHLETVLRPYQRVGVDWLVFSRDLGLGCVLADDMGLGKTLQAMCAMRGRVLVVSPTSVIYNWAAELKRFRPELTVAAYHGAKRTLDLRADITLTTYPILRNDADELGAIEWDIVALDESQQIKNPDSQVARAAYGLKAGWKLTLSGTPVENRLDELWSQLHFTNPGLLGGRADFRDRWSTPIGEGDAEAARRLRERIRPFVLRRLKKDVAPELPPRTEAVLHVELDDREREIYDAIRAATQREIVAMLAAGGGVMAALEALLRLRQAACHTALLPGQPKPAEGEAMASSKLTVLLDALTDAAADGHKALVFSQWTSLLDLIEPHLADRGLGFVRLDGSTKDRAGVVAQFQDTAGPPVMLLSLKAGGTGLNLTEADHVFLIDPWWNPAVEEQAADRAHRIGQDKPVMIYRLVARDTVEERILALQAKKRALADAALGEADRAAALTRDDLLALLA
jgi:superfamily II DNA or RNA helicase